MSIAHFLVPFLHTFIFSPSWTMIRVEHFHRENVRMTSLYFFFQNLFSKPLVSKIVTTHESFVSKTHKIELLFCIYVEDTKHQQNNT